MSGACFVVPAMSRAAIRSVAHTVHDMLGPREYFPIIQVVELLFPKLCEGFELHIRSVSEMGNNHGLTIPQHNQIHLREDVYEGAINGLGRDRMTVAHEVGHFILHRNVPLARALGDARTIKAYCSSEWQANAFGGELLIDSRLVRTSMPADEVARRFGVSLNAAETQLRALKGEGLI